jgi:hypothetical protein
VAVAAVVVLGLLAAWWVGRRGALTLKENPIANAGFTRFTNFEGSENNAAISPEGKFVAFRADRDGDSTYGSVK